MVKTLPTSIISDSIKGCPEEYRGEHRATWQLNKLREEAQRQGFLRDKLENIKKMVGAITYGTEAEVMFKEGENGEVEVLKAFHPLRHLSPHETLDDFVVRIDYYNQYFPETALEFKGVSESNSGITVLFSQRYIDGLMLMQKKPPLYESFAEAKIRLKEEERLFKKVAGELKRRHKFLKVPNTNTRYTDGKIMICDVHLGNVMKGVDDKLYYIDVDVVLEKTDKTIL